jgi:hypothetical protein
LVLLEIAEVIAPLETPVTAPTKPAIARLVAGLAGSALSAVLAIGMRGLANI